MVMTAECCFPQDVKAAILSGVFFFFADECGFVFLSDNKGLNVVLKTMLIRCILGLLCLCHQTQQS